MSDQDAADLISLPQGGGALKGIGETFSPDLHMGTGNYRLPLEVPSGRHGLQPRLALAYSSGSPNGPFGLGWSLDVPSVQRKTSKGVPRYDVGDVFVLSGAEDLTPVPGGTSQQALYRPRTEGLFARIVHHTEPGADYWMVWSKDGLRSVYGTPPPAVPPAGWQDPAIVVDPADPARRRILAWRLTATVDTFGNRIEYAYTTGDASDAQLYLSEVRYADYGDPASPGFLVSIRLQYEVRPDPFTDRRGGFAVRTSRRCTAIETWTQAGQPVLARTVHLDYLDGTAANGVSLLGRVRVEGHDGATSQWMPPVELAYAVWAPQARRYQQIPAPGGGTPSRALGRSGMDLVDLFGDGLPAVVELDGQARYWRNAGGSLEAAREMRFAPAGASLGQPGVQLADVDGDGRIDLLVTDGRGAGYYPLAGDGGFDPSGFVRLRQAPTFDLTDPLVRLVDLDGDGVIDALRTGDQLQLFYNDRLLGFDRLDVRRRGAEAPDVAFSDPRVKLADMTGDGLTDLVLVQDRHVQYWPYAGYGRWGQPVTMAGSPAFEDSAIYGTAGHDPRRVLLGDVDGDGCADVVYVGDGHTTVWINRTGAGFAAPVVIQGTPPVTDAASVRLADMLGTGTAGVLWTYDQGAERGSSCKFLDLTGGTKPYLLASIDNHMGATTTIEYGTSTDHAVADRRAGRPWRTTLPFPVHVVARVTISDHFSQSAQVSEFRYHHGYWDGAEREFRGFGRTDRRDTLSFSAPAPALVSAPTELRSWFHLGPVGPEFGAWRELDLSSEYWPGDPPLLGSTDTSGLPAGMPRRALRDAIRALRGSTLRTELYAADGTAAQYRPYTVTERQSGVLPVLDGRQPGDPGWAARPVVLPCQLGERVSQWERGTEPRTTASFTAGYDAYGRPSTRVEAAVPRATDPRTGGAGRDPYLATSSRTQYATRDDATGYMVDRVTVQERVEVVNDGSLALLPLRDAVLAGTLSGPVRSLELTYYDGSAFVGLPSGQLGDHGLKTRSEQLVLTAGILLAAYQSGDPTAPLPPYLPTPAGGQPAWTTEYPPGFQALVPAGGGYTYLPELAPHRAGWYAQTERTRYDVQDGSGALGMATARRDPLGNDTTIAYDAYQLLVASETDALRMVRTAAYDYRVLQPALTTDVNGNQTQVGYTPLGLPAWIALTGKPGANEGDTVDQPGTLFEYGLTAWDDSPPTARQPSWTHTTRRVQHRWQLVADVNQQRAQQGLPPLTDAQIAALFPADERSQFPERFIRKQECSDGFGRLAQTRTQAADVVLDQLGLTADLTAAPGDATAHQVDPAGPPAVVVSGWQVYDDKGRVVEKWEPFLDTGYDFRVPDPGMLAALARQVSEYDPRGLAVRVIGPDGSEQRVVPGVPADLTDPTTYRPTPWESYTYDANDNAGRTHRQQSQPWSSHWNTPSSAVEDALGRVIVHVERTDTGALSTQNVYDIDGNLLQVVDPLGRTASVAVFDLLKRAWRQDLLDAGLVRTVFDAAGSALERRDARGALVLSASDALHRPVRRWASDAGGPAPTLRELTVYGDDQAGAGLTPAAASAANALGRVWASYDEAGLVQSTSYDLAGNLLEKVRQVLQTGVLLAGLPAPGGSWSGTALRVDWEPPAGQTLAQHAAALLDPTPYALSSTYDGLSRRTSLTLPVDVTGVRHQLHVAYDRAGMIAGIGLDGTPYVRRIVYNARGQRVVVLLGCGTMVRSVRDPVTFRLVRLRSEPYTEPQPLLWRGGGAGPAQDAGYAYDLVGNALAIHDRTPGSGVPGLPDQLDRAFTYDPIYRLTTATGRECDVPPPAPWAPDPRCADLTRARAYAEAYQYDLVGNLLHLAHQAGATTTTRDMTLQAGGNQLATMVAGGTTYGYAYDLCGNLTSETTSRLLEWDHASRLATFRVQAVGADPSLYAQHRYDGAGQRVLKVVRNQGGQLRLVVYVEGAFERLVVSDASGSSAYDTLHVMDAAARVALVKVGPSPPDDPTPAATYHLADQLGSSNVVVDGAGALVNREEYTPFGETSFGSYARKRYRYTGKERDEESGFAYHDARFYAPWLGRWIGADPMGLTDGVNGYLYARANPMRLVDTSGTQSEEGGGGTGVTVPVTAVEGGAGPPTAPEGSSWVPKTATLDAVESTGRAAATSGATITEQSIWSLHWSTRGFLLEDLAGNNVGKTFPLVDYVDSSVVRQIKSIDSSNVKYVRTFVRKAARDALEFIKRNPVAQAGKDAEVLAVMKTGTARQVVNAARNALGGSKQLKAAVKVVKGLPGKLGGAFHALGTAAGVWSAVELYGDLKRGDVQAGVGNALNVASTGLSLGARGLAAAGVSGTAVAAGSAVVGAGAVGWTIGTLINSQLSEETQNLIGGTINQIVNEGGWKHPFGLGW